MNKKHVRQLILHNQHLTNPIKEEQVVKDMCGLQAQFFNNPKMALQLRSTHYDANTWQKNMIKTWTLRGTLHMVHEDDLSLFMSLHRLPSWFESYNQDIPLQAIEQLVNEYLKTHSSIARGTLKNLMEKEGYDPHSIDIASNAWGGIFMKMAHQGKMVFSAIDKRDFKVYKKCTLIDEKQAKTKLLVRYFQFYGPATVNDAAYFTKFKKAEIKKIVATLALHSCEVEGRVYYYYESNEKTKKIPEVLLLGAFDPLMLGYEKKESLFLKKEDIRGIFNLTGIVFAPILYKGEVIGRWKKEKSNVLCYLFEKQEEKVMDAILKYCHKNLTKTNAITFEVKKFQ